MSEIARAARHRIIALVTEDGMRRLSGSGWRRLAISFALTVPAAVEQIASAPGGVVIFDPALSDHARDVVLGAAAAAGAQVVLHTQWHHSIVNRILAATRVVVPLDIVCSGLDDVPDRLLRLLDAPYEHSVPTLAVENMARAIQKLPADERAIVVDPFVGPDVYEGAPSLAEAYGFELRTIERHLEKAGIVPPREVLRRAGVARAREMLVSSAATLGVIGARCGLRSESGLVNAFYWALGMTPREAADALDAYRFARELADTMLRR